MSWNAVPMSGAMKVVMAWDIVKMIAVPHVLGRVIVEMASIVPPKMTRRTVSTTITVMQAITVRIADVEVDIFPTDMDAESAVAMACLSDVGIDT